MKNLIMIAMLFVSTASFAQAVRETAVAGVGRGADCSMAKQDLNINLTNQCSNRYAGRDVRSGRLQFGQKAKTLYTSGCTEEFAVRRDRFGNVFRGAFIGFKIAGTAGCLKVLR